MWEIGEVIEDMHYGMEPITRKYDVLSHIKLHINTEPNVVVSSKQADQFNLWLRSINYNYSNKMLMIIDYPRGSYGYWTAAYEYDGIYAGIIKLKEINNVIK